MTHGPEPDRAPRRWAVQRSRFWAIWLTVFVGFVLAGTAWSLAQPPFSGVDEIEHFNMGEAVWSRQFIPPLTPAASQFESGVYHVKNPRVGVSCFFAKAAVPASCDKVSFVGPSRQETTTDYLSREPPLPALVNGLPVYIAPNRAGFYFSRGIDTLIGAGGVATAVALAASRRRRFLLAGVVLAATPSTIASFGVIGSSQLEIAAALVVWVCAALLLDGEPFAGRFSVLSCAAATVLVLSRPISFIYIILISVAILICLGRNRLRIVVRQRPMQLTIVVVGAATLFSIGWYFLVKAPPNPHWLQDIGVPRITGWGQRLSIPLGQSQLYWLEAVGAVGFNEYTGPWWMTLAWTALCALMVGVAALLAEWRRIIAVGVLTAAMLLIPIIAEAVNLPKTYLFWEGRYDIPTLAGIILLSAAVLDRRVGSLPQLRRLAMTTVTVVPVLVLALFVGTLRRYTVGTNGTPDPFGWSSGWHPPLPAVVLILFAIVALVAAYAPIVQLARTLSAVNWADRSTVRTYPDEGENQMGTSSQGERTKRPFVKETGRERVSRRAAKETEISPQRLYHDDRGSASEPKTGDRRRER